MPGTDRPGVARRFGKASTLPPIRTSLSPGDLEQLIQERATQQASVTLVEQTAPALGQALETLDRARREMLYGAEKRLVELVLTVSRRVIGRELATQPDLVADLVREGLDALAACDTVRVHLGDGFAVVSDVLAEQLTSRGVEIELDVDAALPTYGCVVETELGRVDESVDVRLSALMAAIESERERRG